MLISIKKRAEPKVEPGAFDVLAECHDRIRRFTKLAEWLARASDKPEREIRENAESVLRYFTIALPRHSADEDESIAPRLLALPVPDEIRVAVGTMTRQHVTIEDTLAQLVPAWRDLVAEPGSLVDRALTMERDVEQLQRLWDTHLFLEETIVFPAARALLPAAVHEEILREMRARR